MKEFESAPGWPGVSPKWTSSAKSGVGTALNNSSRVWFTISHGILNEIYYPRVDQACTRDLGFIVTDGKDFFSEEKRNANNLVESLAEGVPAYRLTNDCRHDKYKIVKEIITDPQRDCVIQKVKFSTTAKNGYRLYFLVSPHLKNCGWGNTGWTDDYKGLKMLYASRDGLTMAAGCSVPWKNRSVGFVGPDDPWHDLKENKQLTILYQKAENGNISLIGEIDLQGKKEIEFVITVGFGQTWSEAAQRARASLLDGYDYCLNRYIKEWQNWLRSINSAELQSASQKKLYLISASVLRIHEAKRFPGGLIASLSIPWGFAKGDEDLGGYHLVWPRDLVETAGGLLAINAKEDAVRVLNYLMSIQEEDGHWSQNMWLDGSTYWYGIQMDETAFPILLIDLARREGAITKSYIKKFWPMLKKAVSFLISNGPVTMQDRWEEDAGYSPFTLSVEIAALLVAADMSDLCGESNLGKYLRDTADAWNSNIERWTYAKDSDLARQIGIEGYYVRIAPPQESEASSPAGGFVTIKNRPPGNDVEETVHIISPDALALVRFGLRDANDPRIVNTVKAIDTLLKVDTGNGPAWHRYNDDGYGEHEDGSAFDGTGIGRAWPLLTGERAHFEIAAGRTENAKNLLNTLETFANDGGMIPEQIWDDKDIPEKELFFGKPAGSAMPLVWAHAEYIKLCRSVKENKIFDMPPQTYKRYIKDKVISQITIWRFNNKCSAIPAGNILRIEVLAGSRIRWTNNNWLEVNNTNTADSGLGINYADIDTRNLQRGDKIIFTFYWFESGNWEGRNFTVELK